MQETVLDRETSTGQTCIHHWIIDSPAGPVSNGTCRLCGDKREFRNSFEGSYWGDDGTRKDVIDKERLLGMSVNN